MYTAKHRETREKRFEWHPKYRGRTAHQVFHEVRYEIAQDQKAFMDSRLGTPDIIAAEAVDARWRDFSPTWFDMRPGELAAQAV